MKLITRLLNALVYIIAIGFQVALLWVANSVIDVMTPQGVLLIIGLVLWVSTLLILKAQFDTRQRRQPAR